MKTRVISGILVAVIGFAFIYVGGPVLLAGLWAIACIAYNELGCALGTRTKGKLTGIDYIGYIWITGYYAFLFFRDRFGSMSANLVIGWFVALFMILMAVFVFTYPRYNTGIIIKNYFAIMYAPVMLGFLYMTRSMEHGILIVWLIYISSWVCDTCAYFTGVFLGKHRLAPILSPKKSIEGSIGGVLGSAVVGALYSLVIADAGIPEKRVTAIMALICALGAVISQIGDLAASAIKRDSSLDDYGDLIPGHGGVMDRFDSVIFTAPVIYFTAALLIGV